MFLDTGSQQKKGERLIRPPLYFVIHTINCFKYFQQNTMHAILLSLVANWKMLPGFSEWNECSGAGGTRPIPRRGHTVPARQGELSSSNSLFHIKSLLSRAFFCCSSVSDIDWGCIISPSPTRLKKLWTCLCNVANLELFVQVGLGSEIIVPYPYLTFLTRKPVLFWKFCLKMAQFVFDYMQYICP